MKKLVKKFRENEKGFTLIELIIVIAILAIISAIAIPNILTAVDNARRTTDVSNAKVIADSVATLKTQNDAYAGITGTFTFNVATNQIVPTPSTSTEQAFADALEVQLSNAAIIPKYKGTGAPAAANLYFTVVVDNTTGEPPISVYIGPVSETDTSNTMLYPTVDSDYTNQ